MSRQTLYPLRFDPIYQYRLWGGRRLADLLSAPLPGDGPVSEVLSDREDHPSRVADGPLKGLTISQLMDEFPEQLMGELVRRFRRFPLLLKFLDVHETLSVQVDPTNDNTDRRRPPRSSWATIVSPLAGGAVRSVPLKLHRDPLSPLSGKIAMSLSKLGRGTTRGLLPLTLLLVMPIHAQNVVPVEEENPQIHLRSIPAFSAWEISVISVAGVPDCCDPQPSPLNPDYAAKAPLSFSTGDKASFYLHRVLDFGSALGPAVEAAAVMASPPKAYPSDWRQGMAAFGRNYGAVLGRVQVAEFSRFAAGAALREDPRYYPSPNRNAASRILHAVGFTLADHSDSGQVRPAFANFIGATAGGFVGDAYLPNNYTDLRHAGVRIGIQMTSFAVRNLADEFAPEFDKMTRALKTRLRPAN